MDLPITRLESILVESFLSPKANQQFAQGKISRSELEPWISTISALSGSYNTGAPLRVDAEKSAQGYALYFTPINFAKVEFLLTQIPPDFWSKPLRVLDLGCGPGTAAMAALATGARIEELVLVDSSAAMLNVARTLAEKFLPGSAPKTTREVEGKFDLILAANVLNELSESELSKRLESMREMVLPGGIIVLLEPALKPATHRAMQSRDLLLRADAGLVPLFPCKRRDDCPMLKTDPENWCHGTLRWEEPRLTKQLDELLGFNKHRIKFSGFVFQKNGVMREGVRILGEPKKRKYGMEALVCGPEKYGLQVLNSR